MRIAICDDKKKCRQTIFQLITDFMKQHPLHYKIDLLKPEAFHNILSDCKAQHLPFSYDLIILDIELNQAMNGIDYAHMINEYFPHCQIIFVSGYNDYATLVYETEHCYFISKSLLHQKLPLALTKCLLHYQNQAAQTLFFSRFGRHYAISSSKILYLESLKRNTVIHTNTKTYTASNTINQFSNTVNQCNYLLFCHQNYIINIHFVEEFYGNTLLLKNEIEIPISRSHLKEIRNLFP